MIARLSRREAAVRHVLFLLHLLLMLHTCERWGTLHNWLELEMLV